MKNDSKKSDDTINEIMSNSLIHEPKINGEYEVRGSVHQNPEFKETEWPTETFKVWKPSHKQYTESSYPGRDGIGADIKVWNLCERCGERLKPGKEVWLELDTRTHTFTDQEVPAEHSQGGFPFGKACAKKALKEHKEKT